MTKKLFVVSDVHGHYTEMLNALNASGFEPDNPTHIFVSCGDLFDRGIENVELYNYVQALQHKILIKGNHEAMLLTALKQGRITFVDACNGTDITVIQMLGDDEVDKNGCFDTVANASTIGKLTAFINSMLDYYETDSYIFTHGWVPIAGEGKNPIIHPSWRTAGNDEWDEARYLEWQQLYDKGIVLDDKTIVCGHRPCRLGSMFDDSREPDDDTPFYGKGIIAIDTYTSRTKRVNVLVLELDQNL